MSSCADDCSADERPPPGPGGAGDVATVKEDYDFIEQPSQDYFCPVTFELLLHPDQTTCCGHHISREAVVRIQRDKKPCPMCKEPNLTTVPDKFFRRKVHELKVRCSHTKNGCEWVGDLGSYDDHVNKCPKRPWRCEFCDFKSTHDIGNDHLPNCAKRPIPCPNSCEIGTIAFSDVESHLLECPLQLVACELAHAGCSAKVTRRDLPLHMKESVQQHLLSASLLNLQLTREKIEEKDKQLMNKDLQIKEKDKQLMNKDTQIEEKDSELKEKDKQLMTKDVEKQRELKETDVKYTEMIREKEKQLAEKEKDLQKKLDKLLAEKDRQIAELKEKLCDGVMSIQRKLDEHSRTTEKHLAQQDGNIKKVQNLMVMGLAAEYHDFTLTEFSKHQAKGGGGDWFGGPFYSHPGGYKFKLNIDTNGHSSGRGSHISAFLKLKQGDNDGRLSWPVEFEVCLQLLNQLGDHTHHSVTNKMTFENKYGNYGKISHIFFPQSELRHNAAKNTQYLKDDCLYFKLYIKTRPIV